MLLAADRHVRSCSALAFENGPIQKRRGATRQVSEASAFLAIGKGGLQGRSTAAPEPEPPVFSRHVSCCVQGDRPSAASKISRCVDMHLVLMSYHSREPGPLPSW